jgi:putative hydrolase of the HAD superfamily
MPTPRPVTALFLDIGGVLLSNGWDHAARTRAAATFGLDLDDLELRHHLTFNTYEEGKLSLAEYLERVVFFRERPFAPEAFEAFMFSQSRPDPDMIALMRGLKQRHGLKVVVVSNEGRELNSHRIGTFGLRAFVDLFISSCFVHLRKPDRDFFRMALDISQVPAAEAIYVDDQPMFVQVAATLGLRGIVHRGLDSTRDLLAQSGLT